MISSKQNSLVKEIRSLRDKKNRDNLGVFVVEGVKPVKEAMDLSLSIREIVCTENKAEQFFGCPFKVEIVTSEVFNYISEEVTPQGVLAVAYKKDGKLKPPTGSCLLLDGVADPNNVGAIIRTAVASGYKDIYMTLDSADAYSQKAVRCSMSGVFRANVMRGAIEDILKVINLPLCIADMDGENVFELKGRKDFCLIIGNEGKGVSLALKKKADLIVSIPMENGMESLNASVSAGILMYALKNNGSDSSSH